MECLFPNPATAGVDYFYAQAPSWIQEGVAQREQNTILVLQKIRQASKIHPELK